MNNYVEKIGRVRAECGFRNVYKAMLGLICDQCDAKIKPGEMVTRAAKKTSGPHSFVCIKCRPIENIEKEQDNKKMLKYFVSNSDWFYNANGNALELLDQIAEACGYERFYLGRTFNYAMMVYWHIQNYRNELLATRFLCLVNEEIKHFPEVKSKNRLIFDAEESPGPRAS